MTFPRSLSVTAVAAFGTLALVAGSGSTLTGQESRGKAALMNPAELKEQAPDVYKVNFDTSAGQFVIEVQRKWAPIAADRFYNLVKRGFYDDVRFDRVVPGFVVQFGAMSVDPEITRAFTRPEARIRDDPWPQNQDGSRQVGVQSNKKGFIAFANSGLNRRTTAMMIHLADNPSFDEYHTPFGQVVSGMNVLDRLYSGYGDEIDRTRHAFEGNAYLAKELPKLDYIKMATIAQ